MNVIEELRWRGLLQDAIPGTEAFLNAAPRRVYLGVDPTGSSIHIGNLVALMMLVHMQRAGHHPVALVGGATAMVGDPSGKDKERQLLSIEEIRYNSECIRRQIAHFLQFEDVPNPAVMVNNYDWLGQMGFLEFLRDVGKHLTVNYMMSKESVRKRMAGDSGISYTEFAYQLLQGYDFLHLYQHHGVQLQVGGSDQWGNITTGTELIRRKLGPEAEAYAAVCPLLTREDGSKFGKTADGQSIWLDPARTSPYEFYQYWRNAADADAERYIRIFTLKPQAEIEALAASHAAAPHLWALQKALAEDVTRRVHGEAGLAQALKLTEFLFGGGNTREALAALAPEEWHAVTQAPEAHTLQIPRGRLELGVGIIDLLHELGIAASKGEARRAIEKDRSIRLNAERVDSLEQTASVADLFHGRYLQIQKGKRDRYIVTAV
jgi:tyrosyl-tRNA synthetase